MSDRHTESEKGAAASESKQSEPLERVKAYARGVHEKAKELLLADGGHAEMMFFLTLDERCHVVQWQGTHPEAKASWMRQHIHDHYIYGVIHVCECWVRIARDLNDPITNNLVSGNLRVSELPEEDRIEALSVVVQTRDGYALTWVDQIVRDGSGKVVGLGMAQEFKEMGGRLGELFK
jgi:hypothetical protein